MKVSNIAEVHFKQGGSGWKVELEGTDKVLWLKQKPDFEKGHDIPDSDLEVNAKGNYQLKGSRPGSPKRDFKPSKNDDDIMLQVAFKGAIELEKHHFVPEGKITTGRIMQATSEIYAALLLMRPTNLNN